MRKKKKVSSNVLNIVQKQRHLALLQKVQSGRPLSAREAGELNKYENPTPKQTVSEAMSRELAKKNQVRRAAQNIGVLTIRSEWAELYAGTGIAGTVVSGY